ncbi:MAG: hypothetical protein IKM46_09515 [Clostridia bacterium]|nr:hypothetical protein [Clostridia bacterium]
MRLKLILDRVEEGIVAVLTDDDCKTYECPASLLPDGYRESDAFFGETDGDGRIVSLEKRENPDAGKNRKRLRALFNKTKNNK